MNEDHSAPGRNEWSEAKSLIARHKGLHIALSIVGGVWLLLTLCVALFIASVNTDGVHRYLIGLAERKASEELGIQVRLQNFVLRLNELSVDLYGVQASGTTPHENPPLFTASHIGVGVRIVSIFGGKWYLDHLQIDHPVVWLTVDKNGVSNLPKMKSSGSNHTDVFRLGIRHAVLDRGEVYYNDRPSSLTADLHNLDFRAAFEPRLTIYRGTLAYSGARLAYGTVQPVQHDLNARFVASPTTFEMTEAKITSGNSEATVSAVMNGYGNPHIKGQYALKVDCGQIGRILNEPSMPKGTILTSGAMWYRSASGASPLLALAIQGQMISNRLSLSHGGMNTEVTDLAAQYSLENGDVTLRLLRAVVLGGVLKADAKMAGIGGNSHTDLNVDFQNVSLADVQKLTQTSRTRNLALQGAAEAKASAHWGKTIDDLVARGDVKVRGQMVHASGVRGKRPSEPALPIDGAVHAEYVNQGQELKLTDSYVRSGQTNLGLNGKVSRKSALAVDVECNDLRELIELLDMVRTPSSAPPQLDLRGKASFHGNVRGSITTPRLTGELTGQDIHYNGSDWKVVRTGLDLSPSYAGLQNVDLESANRTRITGTAGIGLRRWSPAKQSSILVDLNASQLDLAQVARMMGNSIPVSGVLNAKIHALGSVANPQGNGNVSLTKATAYEQPVSLARVDFTGSGHEAQARLTVQIPAGSIQARVTSDVQQRTFTAQVDSSGIELAKLQAIRARNIDAKGALAIHARGSGSFDNPAIDASLEIPSLSISGQDLSGLRMQVNVANRVARAEMTSSAAKTQVYSKVQLGLSGDYPIDASLDTEAIPIQELLAAFAPSEAGNLSGETEIHGTMRGPLKRPAELQAQVTVPVLKVAYGSTLQFGAPTPIRADYQRGEIHLQPATIRGTDTDLQVEGSIPIGSGAPMSLRAHGSVNLELIQVFDSDVHSSGKLQINIDSQGTKAGESLGGEIDIVDANLSSATTPVGLSHANGVLRLTPDRLEIASFQGTMGGGAVSAQGAIMYRPMLRFNLGAAAKGVRMLYPTGVRETVDADLRLGGTTQSAVLGGSVKLTDLALTPAFDIAGLTTDLSSGVAAPPGQGFAQNLRLNLAVISQNNVNLVSQKLSLGGSANLQVRGTAADPVILGRVNVSGGDLIFRGNRFVITGGTVQFINPTITEPVVNVSLNTTIQQYKIDLRFNGPVDQLQTQYTSDPSLPPADIIHLLAFGQTSEASAMNTVAAPQQAESLVASQVSSQVTSRISRAAGISQLSISPVLQSGTAAGPQGAQLTIQQRVTGNLFITFSTNVSTTQGQTIQGQYQVSPRVALSATRNPNGGFGFDTLIKKSW